MIEAVHGFIDPVVLLLELLGVVVIVLGVVLATAGLVRALFRREARDVVYERYRANLGRGILLGLEFLVGADIVATVTAPLTFSSVGLLALIVLIRTFLSFALETEIAGRWPWKRSADEPRR